MKPFFRISPMRLVILLVLLATLAVACMPSSTGTQQTPPIKATDPAPVDAAPTKFPTPFENQIPVPPAAQAAQELLAKRLSVPIDQVTISEIEQVQWSDACLGLQKPDEACLTVITDGFRVMLTAGGQSYEAHTDMEGTQVRFAEDYGKGLPQGVTPQPGTGGDAADLEEKIRQALAKKSGIALDQIKVVDVEPVEWPDGCLGVITRGVSCIQVITPGYRVMLEANGQIYEFHTDQLGNTILQANGPSGELSEAVVVWEQTEDGVCSQVEVNGNNVKAGPCGKPAKEAALSSDRMKELVYFETTFESFTAETKSGTVTFTGSGTQQAEEADQRSLAEWARLVYQDTQTGSAAASVGALIWHREGGIAGFCDDLTISLSGWAEPSTCKGGQVKSKQPYRLSADDLEKIYAWIDRFENFEYEQKDAATADSMTIKMVFIGSGSAQAAPAQQEEIAAFAASVYATAARQQ